MGNVPSGLYNPAYEHDSCGVAMVADMHGRRSRDIVDKAITALLNLEHRGAAGAEPNTGDGAGILIQVPDEFLRAVIKEQGLGFELPAEGSYATGIAFLPQSARDANLACEAVQKIVEAEGLQLLGWRDVPHDDSSLGALARDAMPTLRQVFIAGASGMDLERRAYVIRKRAEHELGTKGPGQDGPGRETVYFPSLSGQTFVYKGMLTTPQLRAFYLDLQDERLTSALGIVHSRFSTNTFPSWPLAHPFRRVAHNGEINTVTGNENWMKAREALIHTDVFGYHNDLNKIFPVCTPGASDTARFDEVLELLHLGGRSIAHAVLMMIPEAWERNTEMDPALRAFYQYHGSLMEPWDGPASVCFTDGTVIGAVLDRNGLRPSRFWVTDDGLVVLASEAGVLDLDPAKVVRKGRLQPGERLPYRTALELGAGTGFFSLNLKLAGLVDEVHVSDLSPGMVEAAKANAQRLGFEIEGQVADAESLPYDDDSFDRVIASEILEHIHEDEQVMAELFRITKPGGLVAVTVPRNWPEQVCWKLSDEYHEVEGGHIRIYKASELVDKLTRAGFHPYAQHHAHALHAPYWWLKCAVGSDNDNFATKAYHRLLVWDMMSAPLVTRLAEKSLDPVLGKSFVVYLRKPEHS